MKKLRLRRLTSGDKKKMIIVPLDHGLTLGPISGISNIRDTIKELMASDVNGLVLHKGNIRVCEDIMSKDNRISVIMHLSASLDKSPNSLRKVLVTSVEEACRYGVDAVSVHVNYCNKYDHSMLKKLGKISSDCDKWGMPLIAMMYPRGKNIDENCYEMNQLGARIAMELGADIVKINYINDIEKLNKVVESVSIPVLIAGGGFKNDNFEFFKMIDNAKKAGISGVAIGRNVFQHEYSNLIIEKMNTLLNEDVELEDVYKSFVESIKNS